MDNFDLQKYLASGKIHADNTTLTEAKKQGYDDREDESLGARKGAEKGKKQSMKDRRDDSYGKFGKRDAEKKGKNKINKEGIIKESPASNLELKRLAKILFAKFKKSGARVKLGTDVGTIDQEGKTDQWDDIVQALGDHDAHINYGIRAGKEGIHLSLVGEKANSFQDEIKDFINQGDIELYEYPNKIAYTDSEGQKRKTVAYFIAPGKSMSESTFTEDARTDAEQEGYKDGFDDAKDDVKDALSKMKVSELKAKIKETILAELSLSEAEEEVDVNKILSNGGYDEIDDEKLLATVKGRLKGKSNIGAKALNLLIMKIEDEEGGNIDFSEGKLSEEEEVDVDIDVEDEVEVEAGADDIEIKRPGVKTTVDVGLSPEEEVVQDSLKAAMDAAQALGSDKLADQIGNTITFFTRQFVVGDRTD